MQADNKQQRTGRAANNPYATPQADLQADGYEEPDFYVVSKQKFAVLFIATLGMYTVYWFYKNWQFYKDKHGENMWPIARGIFSVFFAHKLFNNVEEKLSAIGKSALWKPASVATMYVIASVGTHILDRLAMKEIGSPYTDILSIVLLVPIFFTMRTAQEKINLSQGDPEGQENSQFTLANWVWIAFGALLWLLILFGIALYFPAFEAWFDTTLDAGIDHTIE